MGRRKKLEGEKGGGGSASLKNDFCFMIVLCLEINGVFFRYFPLFKSVSTRVPGSRATCHLTDFNETLPVLRVYPKTEKGKLVSVLVFSGGR